MIQEMEKNVKWATTTPGLVLLVYMRKFEMLVFFLLFSAKN